MTSRGTTPDTATNSLFIGVHSIAEPLPDFDLHSTTYFFAFTEHLDTLLSENRQTDRPEVRAKSSLGLVSLVSGKVKTLCKHQI